MIGELGGFFGPFWHYCSLLFYCAMRRDFDCVGRWILLVHDVNENE